MSRESDLDVVQRWICAVRQGDWDTYADLVDLNAAYRFHSQYEAHGRDPIVNEGRSRAVPGMVIDQDAYVADGSGRVWWRYNASWPDGRSGEVTSTTGASTAVIADGRIVEFECWLDLGFMRSSTIPTQ